MLKENLRNINRTQLENLTDLELDQAVSNLTDFYLDYLEISLSAKDRKTGNSSIVGKYKKEKTVQIVNVLDQENIFVDMIKKYKRLPSSIKKIYEFLDGKFSMFACILYALALIEKYGIEERPYKPLVNKYYHEMYLSFFEVDLLSELNLFLKKYKIIISPDKQRNSINWMFIPIVFNDQFWINLHTKYMKYHFSESNIS